MAQREKSKVAYSYTLLNNVTVSSKVNVYGVVKFIKQPYKTRGSDYCTVISIIDESYRNGDKLKCLLFGRQEELLPNANLGDIIRFHRLTVSQYRGEMQGQSGAGFSWLLFSPKLDDPLEPKNSMSKTYSFTDQDKDMVKKLRKWANNRGAVEDSKCCFNNVTSGNYFDLLCQVVYTAVLEADVSRLFSVWDGTKCKHNVRELQYSSSPREVKKDDALCKSARNFTYDVTVFEDHFQATSHIKPGDYVQFINLHAADYKLPDQPDAPCIEFCLHRGNSFGRCAKVVSPDSQELAEMKQRQELVGFDNESFNMAEISSGRAKSDAANANTPAAKFTAASSKPDMNRNQVTVTQGPSTSKQQNTEPVATTSKSSIQDSASSVLPKSASVTLKRRMDDDPDQHDSTSKTAKKGRVTHSTTATAENAKTATTTRPSSKFNIDKLTEKQIKNALSCLKTKATPTISGVSNENTKVDVVSIDSEHGSSSECGSDVRNSEETQDQISISSTRVNASNDTALSCSIRESNSEKSLTVDSGSWDIGESVLLSFEESTDDTVVSGRSASSSDGSDQTTTGKGRQHDKQLDKENIVSAVGKGSHNVDTTSNDDDKGKNSADTQIVKLGKVDKASGSTVFKRSMLDQAKKVTSGDSNVSKYTRSVLDQAKKVTSGDSNVSKYTRSVLDQAKEVTSGDSNVSKYTRSVLDQAKEVTSGDSNVSKYTRSVLDQAKEVTSGDSNVSKYTRSVLEQAKQVTSGDRNVSKFSRSVLEKSRLITTLDASVTVIDNAGGRGGVQVDDGVRNRDKDGGRTDKDVATVSSSLRTCMVQTSTVIVDHPHISRSKIRDVLEYPSAVHKFRVLAQVLDYHPKPEQATTFLALYCSVCNYLSSFADDKNKISGLSVGSSFKGVPHYMCPTCFENRHSLQGLESPPHLQYIYMFRFILCDGTGKLVANIWRSDAVKFFQDIEPEDVIKSKSEFKVIRDFLDQICPKQTALEDRPWLECCLKSYTSSNTRHYQIFDTVIV